MENIKTDNPNNNIIQKQQTTNKLINTLKNNSHEKTIKHSKNKTIAKQNILKQK